jgi:ATP-binding cassette subfamily B protein
VHPHGRPAQFSSNGHKPPADQIGKRRRVDLAAIRKGVSGTWRATVRVFQLVWSSSRHLTAMLASVTLLQSVVPVLQVWLAGRLIDEVVEGIRSGAGDDHLRPVVILAILQLLLFLGASLLQTLGNISQQLLQEKLAIHVQLQIMEHANTLDLADFENAAYYDQLQQAQRESANRPVQMVSGVFGLVRSIITFATMIALLASLSPWIAVATLVTPIPAFISGSKYGWWGFQQMRRQSPVRRLLSYLTSLLTTDSFNKEIKLFTLGDHFIERYRKLSDAYYEETRQLLVRRYLAAFAWGSLTIASGAGTFLYVAILALRGTISVGSLTVFAQAVQQVQGAFQGILGGVQGTYENGLYLSTLYDLLDRKPLISAPADPAPIRTPFREGITFEHVTYRYPGNSEAALEDVSFRIEPGETIALVGRNGAGKSTIVKLLGRLYDPTEGRIMIDGRDVREYDPKELRQQFGMMFQDYAEYQLSARENIGVGNVARVDDLAAVAMAAERSGATGVIEGLPKGFETNLGKWFEDGHQLSGGEWQKVALARAFMRDAQVLILDEPTSALDAQAEHDLFERIRQLTEGKMAVFISHRFSTARKADKILVLHEGRLIEAGTHDELIALGGQYAQLFELQAASYR